MLTRSTYFPLSFLLLTDHAEDEAEMKAVEEEGMPWRQERRRGRGGGGEDSSGGKAAA